MSGSALVVTSEFSRGARAMGEALERAGFRVGRSTLERVALGLDAADLYVDRSVPPYDLPAVRWDGVWWNSPGRSWDAWSKVFTALRAVDAGLPHPRTVAFESLDGRDSDAESEYVGVRDRAAAVLDLLGGRAVVKPDRGLMGEGVCLVDSLDDAVAAMSRVRFGVVQEYVPEASTTLRVVCAGGVAVAAFARVAGEGDWRGNVAAGASVERRPVGLDDPSCRVALDAMSAFGLDFAGVDVVETADGPVFLEANPAFGVNGLLRLFPDALDGVVLALSSR